MKTYYKIIIVLACFIHTLSLSQASREILIEDSLYQFHQNYNMAQKLIDSTSLTLTTTANKNLFKQFFRGEIHPFFMNNFNLMLDGTINASFLPGRYEDQFISLKVSTSLMTRFNAYKIELANHTGHNHGGEIPESGNCDNVDFELGGWTHWSPFIGDVNIPGTAHPIGAIQNIVTATTVTGQHTIVTGGNDRDVTALPRVNPNGGSYSLMLGDSDGGYEVSIMRHKTTITKENPYFTYDFAVVLEDPNHGPTEQPFFNVQFFDSNGNIIPSCGNYFVSVQPGIPGFITAPSTGFRTFRYKPWSRITVDLNLYIGQEITIVFSVADCGAFGHLGRAYIDGNCFKPEIEKEQDCLGIKLSVDSGYLSYQWYQNDSTIPPDSLAPVAGATDREYYIPGPGEYKVRIISESGCTLNIDTLINDIYIILNQSIEEETPSCFGVNDGKLTLNAYGGKSPYTYSIDNGVNVGTSNTFSGLAAGIYTCIVYDSGGCMDTVIYNLKAPPDLLPNLIITNTLCASECNGVAEAFPSGGTSPTGYYQVEFDNVFSISQKRNNFCAGIHTVKVIDENGCSSTTPFTITSPAIEVIDNITVKDEDCFNDCSGIITITDASAIEYSIDDGMSFQTSNVFSNLCSQAGPYSVAIKTANGCIGRTTTPLNQPQPLVLTPQKDSFICLNKFASFIATPLGGTAPYTVNWSEGTTGLAMSASPKTSTAYQVTVTDANGCTFTDDFNINLHPQPAPRFEVNPGPTTDVFNVDIEFTNTTEYPHSLTYEWYLADLATFNTRDAALTFPDKGGKTYLNCLKVENEEGCRDSICQELYVNHELLVFVANTFTPNNDAINEIFTPQIEGLNDEGYQFMIFNRWGNLLYSTQNKNEGWDGKYKGKLVKEDVYIYRIEGVITQTQEDYEKSGHVTVLRKL